MDGADHTGLDHTVLRARALNAVAHTRSLVRREPAWGSEIHPVAGGWLVLAGAGMYVNQLLGAGMGDGLTSADLDLICARSVAAGVTPAIEVTSATLPENVGRIRERGFVHDSGSDIILLTKSVKVADIDTPDDVVIRPAVSEAGLHLWQQTSASGWGHASSDARRASDAFAAAAHALDNEHMVVAFDPVDDRPVGCASMTVTEHIAMLGGMSTLPAERRRGVQAAMLRYRLAEADRLGCEIAVTTAASGGASERNLRRHGFNPRGTIQKFSLPAG